MVFENFFLSTYTLIYTYSYAVQTCATDELFFDANNESFLQVKVVGENFTDVSLLGDIRYGEGSLGTFTCRDKDMQLIGEAHTICLRNGSWTDPGDLKCGINI